MDFAFWRTKPGEGALLRDAVKKGDITRAGKLLQNAKLKDINETDKDGKTALMHASFWGRAEMVQVLVAAGADKNMQDKDGKTALMWASYKGHAEVVQLLVAAGADMNMRAKDGKTALMHASFGGRAEMVQVLLAAGADKNMLNKSGRSAFDYATSQEIRDILNADSVSPAAVAPAEVRLASPSPAAVVPTSPLPAPAPVTTTSLNTAPHTARAGVPARPAAPAPVPTTTGPTVPLPTSAASVPTATVSISPPPTPASTDFTEQDRGALITFFQHSTELLQGNARLQQVMRTVAAHDRTLQMLVSKEKECPSLFWFYPKKPELRRWLSDPAKCLFQDTLMMVVVCPVTLRMVECGPDGVGWEVNKPKEWVKKWGPAILFSIYVMQAAVVAGRVVGIPLPPVPGAGEMKEALGLKGMLGDVFSAGANHVNLKDSLKALRDTTAAALEQTPAARALCDGLQSPDADSKGDACAQLPVDLPMHMVGEAYKSIHTFLTTGKNAELGKLEDQLRGRMERVMAPDGDVEWVSVQGRDAWLQKRASESVKCSWLQKKSVLVADANPVSSTSTSAAPSSVGASAVLRVDPVLVPLPLAPAVPAIAPEPPTWLGEKLAAAGFSLDVVQLCDRVLVREEGFCNEKRLARTPSGEFDRAYLTSVGISGKGLQLELLELHRELRGKCETSTPSSTSSKIATAAEFTEEDRQLLRQLKLQQQRAPAPTTTHTVDRGNQMQYTASAFSQQGPLGAQDQQQLARRIAELEARLARAEGVVTEHITDTALQLEDVHGRVDQLTPPPDLTVKGSDKGRK